MGSDVYVVEEYYENDPEKDEFSVHDSTVVGLFTDLNKALTYANGRFFFICDSRAFFEDQDFTYSYYELQVWKAPAEWTVEGGYEQCPTYYHMAFDAETKEVINCSDMVGK